MAAAADVDEVAAADIICSLRGADLAGWTPPWRRAETEPSPAPAARREGEMVWPAVARGKRSRRRSPSAGSAATGKGRWGRGSPASPLDYSGGSGSAASTSGGEDGGGFCSPGDRRAPANKVRGSVSLFLSRCKSLCRRRRAALGSSPSPTTSTLSLSYPLFSFRVFFCPFPFFGLSVTELPLLVSKNPFPSSLPPTHHSPFHFPLKIHSSIVPSTRLVSPYLFEFPVCLLRTSSCGTRLGSQIRIRIPLFIRNLTIFSYVGFAKLTKEISPSFLASFMVCVCFFYSSVVDSYSGEG